MARIITLDEDSHKYTVDGEPVPSVSELTRFISREVYGEVTQYVLENAAARGTAVHKATEAVDKFGSVECDEDIVPYLEAYIKFRKEHKCEWEKIEWMAVWDDKAAGTLDRLGKVDGVLTILDIKTSSALQKPLYSAQLNFYYMIAQANGYKPEKLAILKLQKDSTYKLVDIPIDPAVPNALLVLHEALKKKSRKRKEKES